jgi:DNA-binding GntR family transcriptional regulator
MVGMAGQRVETITDHRSVQQLVVGRLRDAILDGALPSGARLKIEDLAADLGVSHMPVREALHVLVMEGLAVREPRRGVVVSTLSATDVLQAYRTTGVLEGLVARQAAEHITEADLDDVRRLVEGWRIQVETATPEERLQRNRELHTRIGEIARNRWAMEFLRQLWNYIYRVRHVYPQSLERARTAAMEHEAILEALAARDGERVEHLVREHNDHAVAELVRHLQESATRSEAAAS